MLKTSELCIVEIPLRVRLGRICLELMTFLFMLIPSFFTLYLTDEMIDIALSTRRYVFDAREANDKFMYFSSIFLSI